MTPDVFWNHVDKSGDCWLWQGTRSGRSSYGIVYMNRCRTLAHRVAYSLSNGAIPTGKIVRHRCDNPLCVNPEHLVLGTHLDNARDMSERKRYIKAFNSKCKNCDKLFDGRAYRKFCTNICRQAAYRRRKQRKEKVA